MSCIAILSRSNSCLPLVICCRSQAITQRNPQVYQAKRQSMTALLSDRLLYQIGDYSEVATGFGVRGWITRRLLTDGPIFASVVSAAPTPADIVGWPRSSSFNGEFGSTSGTPRRFWAKSK